LLGTTQVIAGGDGLGPRSLRIDVLLPSAAPKSPSLHRLTSPTVNLTRTRVRMFTTRTRRTRPMTLSHIAPTLQWDSMFQTY